jgi:hypothetical protein
MPILVNVGGTWQTVTDPQVYSGGQWRQVQEANVRDDGTWKQVYTRAVAPPPPPPPPPPGPSPTAFNKSFAVTSKQVYWNSGNQDNQSATSPLFIQGTYDGTSGNIRRTLVFFDDAAIRSFLSGASISEIYFGTTRENTTHGTTSATIRIGTTSAGSVIGSWTGTGITARGSASVSRGQSFEVGLVNSTGTDFQNGTARSIAISTTSTSLGEYGRYISSGSYIRFVGSK